MGRLFAAVQRSLTSAFTPLDVRLAPIPILKMLSSTSHRAVSTDFFFLPTHFSCTVDSKS
jgi:hypothetical protein